MTALVLADRRAGAFGGRFMAIAHGVVHAGHVHGGLYFNGAVCELATKQGRGRERLQRQGQHHENQQEAFEANVHAGSLAKRAAVTK